MMTYDPAISKLLRVSRPIKLGEYRVFPIPPNVFSPEEIAVLRREDQLRKELNKQPFIANFLPDDIRPKGIPKM